MQIKMISSNEQKLVPIGNLLTPPRPVVLSLVVSQSKGIQPMEMPPVNPVEVVLGVVEGHCRMGEVLPAAMPGTPDNAISGICEMGCNSGYMLASKTQDYLARMACTSLLFPYQMSIPVMCPFSVAYFSSDH